MRNDQPSQFFVGRIIRLDTAPLAASPNVKNYELRAEHGLSPAKRKASVNGVLSDIMKAAISAEADE